MVKFWKNSSPPTRHTVGMTQMPEVFRVLIEKQVKEYRDSVEIIGTSEIPDTTKIPLDISRWLKIPDVICVFVDMTRSTQLSAVQHDRSTARAYQLFTGTAVRLFDAFEAPYIDVKGDGVFALFNADQPYRAISAAITFKTFASKVFSPTIKDKTDLDIGAHIGIDQKTVLVRRLGLRRVGQRTDRQNEVWAGKPVNMAAKLAALGNSDELFVSDRFFGRLTDDHVLKSCGCPGGIKTDLWSEIDVSTNPIFDFDLAWRLGSVWCAQHGEEFCNTILALDD